MDIYWKEFYQKKSKSEIGNNMVFQPIPYLLIMEYLSLIVEDGLLLLIPKDKLING